MKRFYLSFNANNIPNYTHSENHGPYTLRKYAVEYGIPYEFDDRDAAEQAAAKLEEETEGVLGAIDVEDREMPGLHDEW